MYRKLCLIIILLLAVLAIPIDVGADTSGTLRIVGDENYPPYGFIDKDGTYKGFNIDILRAISEDTGIDIEINPMPWEEAITALKENRADVIQGIARSDIMESDFSFSNAMIRSPQTIFVRSDTNNIAEPRDLNGLKVAMQFQDICMEILHDEPGVKTVIYKNQEDAIKALLDKKVDAFVGNRLTGLYILQNYKESDKVKIVGEPLCTSEYCIAALKGNEKFLELLNKGLADIKESGEYDRIYHKWFGETITNYNEMWRQVLIIGAMAFILIFAVMVLIFYWNSSLRRLVYLKTAELHIQQEKLEQSNRLNVKILENILDGIIAFNKEGKVLETNKAAKELLRIENKADLTVENLKSYNGLVFEGCAKAMQGDIWRKSIEWKNANNEVMNIDCNIYPIKDPSGLIEGVIVVLHDYTKTKLLNEAKEYDKLKTEFFANMSHEFRTPLSVILAAAQLLELKGKNSADHELGKAIDKTVLSIRQNINRLTRLVNNIIDVTRADTGFLELQLKNQDIINIIEGTTMSVVDLIENKGISIEFDTDVEEKIIACDADKIEKIILNLLSNSVKFTYVGGSISVSIKDGEEYIGISVKDTGVGIPKDKQGIIFDRFRQVDKSISRSSEGSGIGLYLVKSLVELHGGTIRVESTYGEGSEFIIQLPVKQLQEEPDNMGAELLNTVKVETEFSDIY